MSRDLKLIAGLSVQGSIDTQEGFFVQLDENKNAYTLTANIGSDKITKVFIDLIGKLQGPLRAEILHDLESSPCEYSFEFVREHWGFENLDWILQDGFTSIKIIGQNAEVFAGPLQVVYVNTLHPNHFKKVLKHWYVRQKTHLQTLYSVARQNPNLVKRSLSKDGLKLADYLNQRLRA